MIRICNMFQLFVIIRFFFCCINAHLNPLTGIFFVFFRSWGIGQTYFKLDLCDRRLGCFCTGNSIISSDILDHFGVKIVFLHQIDTLRIFTCFFNIKLIDFIHGSPFDLFTVFHRGCHNRNTFSLVGFGYGSKYFWVIN